MIARNQTFGPAVPTPAMLVAGVALAAALDMVAQEAPTVSAPQPNAATVYRRAIAAVGPVLRSGSDEEIDLDFEIAASELPLPDLYMVEPWPGLVAKAAEARTLFAQATQVRDCRFDGVVEPPATELTTVFFPLSRLHLLVEADAWQRLGSDPTATLQLADQLLDHALHVGQDLAPAALLVRFDLETRGSELLLAAVARLPDEPASRAPLENALRQLDSHLARRPDHRAVADRMHASARFLLDHAFEGVERRVLGEGYERLLRDAKAQVLADVDAVVAPLRSDAPPDRELVARHCSILEARWREASAELDVDRALRRGLARPLAAAVCRLYAPNAPEVYRMHLESAARLEAARASLLVRLQRQR